MSAPLSERLIHSVLAVPPLARTRKYALDEAENTKLIRHIEAGGICTLLYGGNANFYHLPLGEYDQVLSYLAGAADPRTLLIPSAGPAYGTLLDQAKILRRHKFETVMVLPQQEITTPDGVEEGIRRFVQVAGIPALLYVKHEGYIEPDNVKRLADDKLICGIKYAIVRPDPTKDEYLEKLIRVVDPKTIISGIGEQPAIIHMRHFGLAGFTSGCVCIAPALSASMLRVIRDKNWDRAERIRKIFKPLEDLRNTINPIRVLHEAVRLAGIAETGPLLPLLTNIPDSDHTKIADAAKRLLEMAAGDWNDLMPYRHMLPRPLPGVDSIGWLDESTFAKGRVSSTFLDKLAALIARELVNQVRSYTYCPVCGATSVAVANSGVETFAGDAEVWVPSADGRRIYAAPNMIWHYVHDHEYLPPQEYLEAVLQFDLSSDWSGTREHERRVRELFDHEKC